MDRRRTRDGVRGRSGVPGGSWAVRTSPGREEELLTHDKGRLGTQRTRDGPFGTEQEVRVKTTVERVWVLRRHWTLPRVRGMGVATRDRTLPEDRCTPRGAPVPDPCRPQSLVSSFPPTSSRGVRTFVCAGQVRGEVGRSSPSEECRTLKWRSRLERSLLRGSRSTSRRRHRSRRPGRGTPGRQFRGRWDAPPLRGSRPDPD